MATKKKTVSELNKIVEYLVEKVKHLEEELKNMKNMEEKIKHLENIINKPKSYLDNESEFLRSKMVQESIKCRKCDSIFKTRKLLRDHMRVNHISDVKCNTCEKTFDEQWKLEKHLSEDHGKEKTFDCEVCDESFFTNWRLRKHMQSHDEPNVKFCHYFNNLKKCPFKEFGCKFRHTKSDQCKYQENCKRKLCQYRHQKDPSTWRCTELNWEGELCRFETTFEVRFENHKLGEHGIGENFNCDHCEFKVAERDWLKKHIEEVHKTKYETCQRNCSDRMYKENTFECENCKSVQCMLCSQSDKGELCWGCDNLLCDD